MSYILDQLKKSGKQRELEIAMRKQAEKPGAKTDEPLLVRSADAPPVITKTWQIALVSVLLGAVVLYGAVAFYRSSSPMRQPIVPAARGPVQDTAQLPAKPLSVPSVQTPQPHVPDTRASDIKTPAKEQKQAEAVKSVKPVTVENRPRNAFDRAGGQRTSEEKKGVPTAKIEAPVRDEPSVSVMAGNVMEFKQLPQSVRKSLPEIRVTSHLYKKDSRLVSINGRIMSEGYNMDDGLYLEEITPEGVILSYGKNRFLVRPER